MAAPSRPPMPPGDAACRLLSELIQGRFGLAFDAPRFELLAARVQPRLRELRLPSLLDYYRYLCRHPDGAGELDRLADLLTNNETYFFREAHHFDIIVRHVLPPLRDALRARPFRALSAGCSSGEEPYSLAIVLHDAGLEWQGITWEIDACDLNRERLRRAREATYEPPSLRACDGDLRRRCFEARDGLFVLRERYRRHVRFFECNLAAASVIGQPPYDVVLCRNVLIYFDDAGFDRVARQLARALAPGGWLLLGHAESLIDRNEELEPVWVEGAMAYRKRDA